MLAPLLLDSISARRRLIPSHDLWKVIERLIFGSEQFAERDLDEHRDRDIDMVPFKGRQSLAHAKRDLFIDQSLNAGRRPKARPLLCHASESSPRSIAQHLRRAMAGPGESYCAIANQWVRWE